MEVVEKKDFRNHFKPLVFLRDDKGRFSLTLSIINEIEFSNKQFWLTILGGYKLSNTLFKHIFKSFYRLLPFNKGSNDKKSLISFRLELREMCVIDENGNKSWFMPNQFAIRRLFKDDIEHGKAFIELFNLHSINCEFTNLKPFSGFYLTEIDTRLNRENLITKSISCIASNESNIKHPNYFKFHVIFDFPNYQITIQEVDITYRQNLFAHLFESDFVKQSDLNTQLKPDIITQVEIDDDSFVRDIPVGDFGGSKPSLTLRKNGCLQLLVDMPPFYDGNGNNIDGEEDFPEVYEFEELISEYTGVRVKRDDREVFIIHNPHPETALKVKEFLENYWALRKDKYKK